MRHSIIAKALVLFMAVAMVFSLCAFTTTAAKTEATVTPPKDAVENQKRDSFTENVKEVDKKISKDEKNFWKEGIKELKKVKSYEEIVTTFVGNFFEVIEDPGNADWIEIGMETLKTGVGLIASCYGLGGVSNMVFDTLMNFGDNPQSESQKLQAYLDEQFDDLRENLDEIQNDISDLSDKVDGSTKEILDALSGALEAQYAKEQVIMFLSSTDGNFNYTQFKNYLYGDTDSAENPFYYTQAYYNQFLEAKANDASAEELEEILKALYRSMASTSQHGDSNLNMFYDYLLENETSGKQSIQRYYYDYLISNKELLGDKNAEAEALRFTMDLYTTALFVESCLAECRTQQIIAIKEQYGANPPANARYVYGAGENDYIEYQHIAAEKAASDSRRNLLEEQMAKDVAYIFNAENSYLLKDDSKKFHEVSASDDNTFGNVQVGQSVYLNKLPEDWCETFGIDVDKLTYEWYCEGQLLGANDGVYEVNGFCTTFDGVVKYDGKTLYSIPFGVSLAESFNGGDGSATNPYLISTAEQFKLIASTKDGMNKHYELVRNIDFEGGCIFSGRNREQSV